ncbi:MAG: transcriptional regulator [Cyclobacteriaceae bacterium]
MKDILKNLHKAFENKVRLGIMSALMVNEYLDFTALRELLDVTDGNLASHMKYLEREEFVEFDKVFLDRKPNTRYSITEKGKKAFVKHIEAIEKLLK